MIIKIIFDTSIFKLFCSEVPKYYLNIHQASNLLVANVLPFKLYNFKVIKLNAFKNIYPPVIIIARQSFKLKNSQIQKYFKSIPLKIYFFN